MKIKLPGRLNKVFSLRHRRLEAGDEKGRNHRLVILDNHILYPPLSREYVIDVGVYQGEAVSIRFQELKTPPGGWIAIERLSSASLSRIPPELAQLILQLARRLQCQRPCAQLAKDSQNKSEVKPGTCLVPCQYAGYLSELSGAVSDNVGTQTKPATPPAENQESQAHRQNSVPPSISSITSAILSQEAN